MKVFQVINGVCAWETKHKSIKETIGMYPKACLFVEAPDYVFRGWGYKTRDDEGKVLRGNDRFIKPIPPEGKFYNDDNGKFIDADEYAVYVEKFMVAKQAANKNALAAFLASHPMTYTDGKQYGVTMEDQSEISLNLTQYKLQVDAGIENPVLQWHAVHEACADWAPEALTQLALAISAYVYPWFNKMQAYKGQIYACTTKEEVEAITFDYRTEEEIAAEEAAKAAAEAEKAAKAQ